MDDEFINNLDNDSLIELMAVLEELDEEAKEKEGELDE